MKKSGRKPKSSSIAEDGNSYGKSKGLLYTSAYYPCLSNMLPELPQPSVILAQVVQTPQPTVTANREQRRTQFDVIIVAIYLICVVYVLYQAFNSLDDQTKIAVEKIVVEKGSFDGQEEEKKLADTPLKDVLDIKIPFGDRYKFTEQPRLLVVVLINKSASFAICADWDSSSLTNYDGRSRRVIRMTPDRKIDLSQRQVSSMIAPGRSLTEALTAEDLLVSTADSTLAPRDALISIDALKKASENPKTPKVLKDMYANFMSRKAPLRFSLRLILQFSEVKAGVRTEAWYPIRCDFTVEKRPWTDYLPFNPKK